MCCSRVNGAGVETVVHRPPPPAGFRQRDQRRDHRPLLVGQIGRVSLVHLKPIRGLLEWANITHYNSF